MTTGCPRATSAEPKSAPLFNAGGAARRLRASPLFAIGPSRPGPALRRGALVALPVGAALLVELGMGAPTKGGIATGAMFAGFPALDAPARTRAAWQATVAPAIGLAAALGALTGQSAALAVPAMALVGAAAGYCFAVSLRLSIAGLSVALTLLVAQGLPLNSSDAPAALLFATAGGLLQAAFSLCVWAAGDRDEEAGATAWNGRAAARALAANLNLGSTSFRHGLRFGAALAAGVAAYWLLGMQEHGFWVPLTILFVLRPEEDETFRRLILRAIGTAVGLLLATGLSFWLHGDGVAIAVALTAATALAYGLLTVQYALFTAAITTYAVLLADTLGEPALTAAGQRAGATAIGIAIAAAAFLLWPNPRAEVTPSPGQQRSLHSG
jgi:Fusaric acid resistance protein-like